MASEPAALPFEALFEHRAFVQVLARQLLRDEHAAEDLTQETWLGLLSSPPRAVRSARTWLAEVARNRALHAQRETRRRAQRETSSARTEAVEHVDVAERVELESRVVRAVLQLRDPYRSVVLGRYYEGRSTKELASRAGITESSVRSQEARALELLRVELDRTFDGGRDAWCLALLPLAGVVQVANASSAMPTVVWSGGGLFVASVGLYVLSTSLRGPVQPSKAAALALAHVPEPAESEGIGVELEPRAGLERQDAVTITDTSNPPRLESLRTPELLVLARQIQRELRLKLLTPTPDLVARFAAVPGVQVARILERDRYGGFAPADVTGIREGGSYFSFVTLSNSYDMHPTVSLSNGSFSDSPGWGAILDLRECDLASVPSTSTELPSVRDDDGLLARRWDKLWSEVQGEDGRARESYRPERDALDLYGPPAVVGHTYVVRSLDPGVFDVLAAFTSLAEDEHGHTLAWRILKSWPIRGGKRRPYEPAREPVVPTHPDWVKRASIEELLAWQQRVRDIGTPLLLDDLNLRDQPLELIAETKRPGGGIARLLYAGKYESLVMNRGGGAYVSFETGSRACDGGEHLVLREGGYGAGLRGNDHGFVLDIGDVPLAALSDDARNEPKGLTENQRAGWDLVWGLRAPVRETQLGREVAEDVRRRASGLRILSQVPALAGGTYLVRIVQTDLKKLDALFAFRDVAGDEDGHVIVWRTLKHFPIERAAPK